MLNMSKNALLMVEEYQGPWKYGQTFHPYSTLNFWRSPISSSSSVIHSWGFLVMSSSSHLVIFLRRLVLQASLVSSNFLQIFVHVTLASPYLLAFVFASSSIWNQTMYSCASISSLYAVKLSNWSAEIYFSCISFVSFDKIFSAPGSRTWYPFIPALAMNLPTTYVIFLFHP